jgi:enediyne polyketide synthase
MYVQDESSNAPVLPVAIVGAALRFPGAFDPVSFHEITSTGRRMFRELARTAVDHDHAHPNGTGPLFSLDGVPLRAALLDDALRESRGAATDAAVATGWQALAVEIAATALADVPAAGRAAPSRTGAIIASTPEPGTPDAGRWVCDSMGLSRCARPSDPDRGGTQGPDRGGPEHGTGQNDLGCAAQGHGGPGGGPRLSCSLAAVVAACEALNTGELDLVLAGGVSTGIDRAWLSSHGRAGTLATEDVRIYDASPTGTLPGEGCGVVALMRVTDARAAGLPVYAEIAGWRLAADGDPEPAAIWPAYLRAGVDPADVQFMEGHGAATAAADLAELSALAEVLGSLAPGAPSRCAFGAVTANIGDTRSAAGVAALLKTVLAMAAGVIPATTGCVRPHRLLRADTTPFRLPRAPEPWPEAATAVAAVNSLGMDGLAGMPASGPAHIVLRREREASRRSGRRRRTASTAHDANPLTVPPPRVPGAVPPRAGARIAPPRPRHPQDLRSPASALTPTADAAAQPPSASAAAQHAPAQPLPPGTAPEAAAPESRTAQPAASDQTASAGAIDSVEPFPQTGTDGPFGMTGEP